MLSRISPLVLLFVLWGPPCSARGEGPADVSPERFEHLLRTLPATAPWQEIPWEHDLAAAQRLAQATRRPVFLWAMEGHPLGAT